MGSQSQTQLSTYSQMLSCVTPFTTCLLLLFSFHLLLHFPIFSSSCLCSPPKQTQRDHVQAEMVEVSDLNSNSNQGLTTLSSSQGRGGAEERTVHALFSQTRAWLSPLSTVKIKVLVTQSCLTLLQSPRVAR